MRIWTTSLFFFWLYLMLGMYGIQFLKMQYQSQESLPVRPALPTREFPREIFLVEAGGRGNRVKRTGEAETALQMLKPVVCGREYTQGLFVFHSSSGYVCLEEFTVSHNMVKSITLRSAHWRIFAMAVLNCKLTNACTQLN